MVREQQVNFDSNQDTSYNKYFSDNELNHCLNLTSETSPGPEKITYSTIKHAHPSMIALILNIFNKIFSEEKFPSNWQTSTIVAIPKLGKDVADPMNYRPISLTSCLCKLLEKMVNIRLIWYLEFHNCINLQQSGFHINRSTTDHLTQLQNDLCVLMSRHLHTIVVFFDLTKAYDMAWRYGILKNLYNFGLRGHLPIFIRNFMTNRSIQVRVGDVLSDLWGCRREHLKAVYYPVLVSWWRLITL